MFSNEPFCLPHHYTSSFLSSNINSFLKWYVNNAIFLFETFTDNKTAVWQG